jgi:hypothetical protein
VAAARTPFPAAFVGTLAVLLVHKGALVAYNLSGAEGRTDALSLVAKSALFLGWDVVGAALLAGLVTLLAWPLERLGWRRVALAVALVPLLAHGFYLGINFFAQQAMGAPIDKSFIDLGFLNREGRAGTDFAPDSTVWDSVVHFLNPLSLSFLALCTLLAPALFLWWRTRPPAPGPWLRRLGWGTCGLLALLTVGLLPHLINGEVLGLRVHTFGLERSPFATLTWSYLRPVWRGLTYERAHLSDPFCMDLSSVERPGALEDDPLLVEPHGSGPRPARTNLVVVVLESVGGRYLDDAPQRMPFLNALGSRPGGASFTAHYSPWPQTMKALFSLACGELPYSEYSPITAVNPRIPCVSLSEALKAAGYATGLFTSQDLAYDRQLRFFRDRGFDVIHDMYSMPGREGAWSNSWGLDDAVSVRAILDWMQSAR